MRAQACARSILSGRLQKNPSRIIRPIIIICSFDSDSDSGVRREARTNGNTVACGANCARMVASPAERFLCAFLCIRSWGAWESMDSKETGTSNRKQIACWSAQQARAASDERHPLDSRTTGPYSVWCKMRPDGSFTGRKVSVRLSVHPVVGERGRAWTPKETGRATESKLPASAHSTKGGKRRATPLDSQSLLDH